MVRRLLPGLIALVLVATTAASRGASQEIEPPVEINVPRLDARIAELISEGEQRSPASVQELALLQETKQLLDDAATRDRFHAQDRVDELPSNVAPPMEPQSKASLIVSGSQPAR